MCVCEREYDIKNTGFIGGEFEKLIMSELKIFANQINFCVTLQYSMLHLFG